MDTFVRTSVVSLGLLAALTACGAPLQSAQPPVCPSVYKVPSLDVQAPYTGGAGSSTYVVYAPSTLKVASDGTYGSVCNLDYFREASLYVGTTKVATAARTPANAQVAAQTPFSFEWNITPGKDGVPLSGEATVQLRVEFQDGTTPTDQPNALSQSAQVVIHSSTTP